jgi:hypothetical protein
LLVRSGRPLFVTDGRARDPAKPVFACSAAPG